MHFPPYWNGKESGGLISLLKEYNIKRVYYGHIHGNYTVPPTFVYDGIEMSIVSADYLKFIPKIVK
jgi:predicted phosphohydrolase